MHKNIVQKIIGWGKNNWQGILVGLAAVVLLPVAAFVMQIFGNVSGGSYATADSDMVESLPVMGVSRSTNKMMVMEQSADMAYPVEPGIPWPGETIGGVEPDAAERKIIRNGWMSLIVKDAQKSAERVKEITREYKGIVDSTNFNNHNENYVNGDIVIRVPVDNFDEVFSAFKDLAITVQSENTSVDDATSRYYDFERDIKSHEAAFDRYAKLFERADEIKDVLLVQDKLDTERRQIESLKGQLKNLGEQTTYSRISVNLTSEAEVKVLGITWSPIKVIKESIRDLGYNVTHNFINPIIHFVIARFIPLVLWLVLMVVGAKVGWKVFRLVFKLLRK